MKINIVNSDQVWSICHGFLEGQACGGLRGRSGFYRKPCFSLCFFINLWNDDATRKGYWIRHFFMLLGQLSLGFCLSGWTDLRNAFWNPLTYIYLCRREFQRVRWHLLLLDFEIMVLLQIRPKSKGFTAALMNFSYWPSAQYYFLYL